MKIETILLTPEKAKELLVTNTNNRPLNQRMVDRLTLEMKEGKWLVNGDTIRVSKTGVLLDGQHRLSAVVKSGITITAALVSEIDDAVFHTIDTGDTRDASDVLAIDGYKSAALRAAVLRILDAYDKDSDFFRKSQLTNLEFLTLAQKHPGLDRSLVFSKKAESGKLIQPSVICAAHYIFSRIDRESADKFITQVATGEEIKSTDAAFVLRRRLTSNLASKSKLPAIYIFALVIKAWNGFRLGKKVGALRFREEGERAERFPRAI